MRLHTFFSLLGLALLLALNLPAQTVRVIYVSGHAELQRPDEAAPHAVTKGETVIIGTRISTGADGRVVLTPMPGVKSLIAPNTIIVLESASDSHPTPNEVTHQATLDLKVGAVVSDLEKQPGASFDYSIRTPRGLAGARGTTFTVGFNAAGIQTIIVSHGTISLNLADGRTISLTIGQVSITQPDGGTEHSGKAGELSPEDQQLAGNWMKTTLETLADAVETGTELQPDALHNALETAKNLGITIPKELQQRVENIIANPPPPTTQPPPTNSTKDPNATPPDQVLKPDSTTTTVTPPSYLTADEVVIFNTLSTTAQQAIINLNDPSITSVILAPDTDTGLTLTNSDIVVHLNALISLKNSDPAAYALFKELAGASTTVAASVPRNVNGGGALPYIDGAPDPAGWSIAAFKRALAMWNRTGTGALTSLEKQTIIHLSTGETIMDRSADYLSALVYAYNALSSNDRNNLGDAGWGRYLTELANNPTNHSLSGALGTIGQYNPALIPLIKEFHIDPFQLLDIDTGPNNNGNTVEDILTALNNLTTTDRATLRKLGAADNLLSGYVSSSDTGADYVNYYLSGAIAFYNSLNPDQQKAVSALGAGRALLFVPQDTYIAYINVEQGITLGDRIKDLAQYYLDHPTMQQTLRDMKLFDSIDFDTNATETGTGSVILDSLLGTDSDGINTSLIQNAITVYNNLSVRTRNYLAIEGQDNSYSFLAMYLGISTGGDRMPNQAASYRPFTEINTLLGSLSPAEYDALLDIDGATAIFETGHLGNANISAQDALKSFLDFYNTGLGNSQKSTLRELGIVGDGNVAFLGSDPADHVGLGRLLTAYSQLSGSLRASTEKLDEFSSDTHFGNSQDPVDRSYFFPRGENQTTLTNVSFESFGNLYVGATKYLVIDDTNDMNVSFTAGSGSDLALRASNLIDLTGTTFSAGIRAITMEAATINLTNINFPGGADVYLNSLYGGTAAGTAAMNDQVTNHGIYPNFNGNRVPGRVNFIGGVKYNGNPISNTSQFDTNGQNIHIGTLANPVVAPPQVNN